VSKLLKIHARRVWHSEPLYVKMLYVKCGLYASLRCFRFYPVSAGITAAPALCQPADYTPCFHS
jgi:hypothetical protein